MYSTRNIYSFIMHSNLKIRANSSFSIKDVLFFLLKLVEINHFHFGNFFVIGQSVIGSSHSPDSIHVRSQRQARSLEYGAFKPTSFDGDCGLSPERDQSERNIIIVVVRVCQSRDRKHWQWHYYRWTSPIKRRVYCCKHSNGACTGRTTEQRRQYYLPCYGVPEMRSW